MNSDGSKCEVVSLRTPTSVERLGKKEPVLHHVRMIRHRGITASLDPIFQIMVRGANAGEQAENLLRLAQTKPDNRIGAGSKD